MPPSSQARDQRTAFSWALIPGMLWIFLFFVLPILLVFAISFASRGPYGGVEWTLSLANYAMVVDPLYLNIYGRSLWLAAFTTLICLVIGYPLAYFIARLPVRWQGIWLLIIIIPFWTNFLVRTYAWMFLLRTEGVFNTVLIKAGLIQSPVEILYTDVAVLIGLVYGYLPFMVLPLYASIERMNPSVVEAAWDLYAEGWSVFWRVIFPLTKTGVIAGCILVFIPSLGAYLTPDLLGGARTMMAGNLIQHEFLVIRDWPFGSAISFILMSLVLLGVMAYFRRGGGFDEGEADR